MQRYARKEDAQGLESLESKVINKRIDELQESLDDERWIEIAKNELYQGKGLSLDALAESIEKFKKKAERERDNIQFTPEEQQRYKDLNEIVIPGLKQLERKMTKIIKKTEENHGVFTLYDALKERWPAIDYTEEKFKEFFKKTSIEIDKLWKKHQKFVEELLEISLKKNSLTKITTQHIKYLEKHFEK